MDWVRKVTTKLVRENQTICLEDLNVRGLIMARSFSRTLGDCGWGEIRRKLVYKASLHGRKLILINQWIPSSKLCSSCGNKKDVLPLDQRVYICEKCGLESDRDINAARNILAAGLAVTACGPERSDVGENQHATGRDEAGTRPGGHVSALTN